MESRRPVLLVGNAGTGKSVLLADKLRTLDQDLFQIQSVPFNFYTTSAMLQAILEKPLEKKAGRNYGPPGTKRLIYFIDDTNMPEVDKYGTVAPHTLIRQHMDRGHWYDRTKLTQKDIHNCQYVACMNPTAGSFTIDPRLQRHFCLFALSFPGTEALVTIYRTILSQHVAGVGFGTAVQNACTQLVHAAIALHQRVALIFLPTAVKFHYIFNLRDLSNIFQDTLETCSKENEFKAVLFALCYFHAVVAERRKFGAQGWNRSYPFSNGDLTISVNILHNYLENNTKVPWDDLRYLFGEIMYGGHITDDRDRRLCKTYLEEFVRTEMLDGESLLAPGFPVPPNSDSKELEGWTADFILPNTVWLGGLFNPQSFLTAIMQATARRNKWPLDSMALAVEVTTKNREDVTSPRQDEAYIHGLFMEGARWDTQSGSLAESRPKELTSSMPVILVKAVLVDRQDSRTVYECPVYKTQERGPTYVWTFGLRSKDKASKWVLAESELTFHRTSAFPSPPSSVPLSSSTSCVKEPLCSTMTVQWP